VTLYINVHGIGGMEFYRKLKNPAPMLGNRPSDFTGLCGQG
jgi:hypothetical protein